MIEEAELKKFFDYQPFEIWDPEGEILNTLREDEFNYYFEIWENYFSFGLPYGRGWINELPWLLDFLKLFDGVKFQIDKFIKKV